MLEWNGENGRNYFFQSEYPYDVDQSYGDADYAGYKVGDNVQTHEAWGTGAYTYFRVHNCTMPSGIKAPQNPGVKFHNSFGRFLSGNGGLKHILNDEGENVDVTTYMKYLCEWQGGNSTKAVSFL